MVTSDDTTISAVTVEEKETISQVQPTFNKAQNSYIDTKHESMKKL